MLVPDRMILKRPNIIEQTSKYLTVFVSEKEGDLIPFSLSGARNIIAVDNRLSDVEVNGGCIRVENYGRVAHKYEFSSAENN
jgi:hypothetical protein